MAIRASSLASGAPRQKCRPFPKGLATFCQTWAEPELLDLMALSFNKIREVPMEHGRYAMEPETMLQRVDENTIMVVPTFGVTYTGADPGYTLFDLADRLRARGWQVPAYTLTGSASDIAVQRVLVRLGFSRDMASLLLDDFRNAVAHFDKHPISVPLSKEESGGFNHM
jgi:glutamate/tyrosine decarboxylase-like PLP-dependent enzyme